MALVPFSYSLRSLAVRRSATVLTVASIGATVAVLAGVLALQQGFSTLFREAGRDDLLVLLRPGAGSEGESFFPRDRAAVLKKSFPEFAQDEAGPLVAGELYLGVRLRKHPALGGGETNVPIRGVERRSFELTGAGLRVLDGGRRFRWGHDEVIVGRKLVSRIAGCAVGRRIRLNTTEFEVVGVFDVEGPYASEIWGDFERLREALQRNGYSRLVGRLAPGADLRALREKLSGHKQIQAKLLTEREYLTSQTAALSGALLFLGTFLGLVMGAAAVFTGTNTMLAALAARTHEIGILLSLGFRPGAIFFAFLLESLLLGLLGGVVGCLLVLPLHGVETGTTNFATFTEVAFAFRVSPTVLGVAALFAVGLGLLGGLLPAWSAASKLPTEALRRR
ncbi:MAG: FtsX-like permease family protein [Planctomycetota bacterium]|nr:MAG: FtsX-like permease family protein [Planctomycetota bacterium]